MPIRCEGAMEKPTKARSTSKARQRQRTIRFLFAYEFYTEIYRSCQNFWPEPFSTSQNAANVACDPLLVRANSQAKRDDIAIDRGFLGKIRKTATPSFCKASHRAGSRSTGLPQLSALEKRDPNGLRGRQPALSNHVDWR